MFRIPDGEINFNSQSALPHAHTFFCKTVWKGISGVCSESFGNIIDYILIRNPTIFLCLWLFNLSLSLSHPPCIATAPEDEGSLHHLLLLHPFPRALRSSVLHPPTCCTPCLTFFAPRTCCPTGVSAWHCLFPASLDSADGCLDFFFGLFSLKIN